MGSTAKRTDPALWDRVKRQVTAGDKGGERGQWSARKAQIAVQEYKRRGGGYAGARQADNSLGRWTREDWGTASGRRSRDSGERYLPRRAREALSPEEYRRTSEAKRRDGKAGRQFSRQPADIAAKTSRARRAGGESKAALMEEARRRGIPGRSRMDKEALRRALRR
ncbi:DUF5872 domain-containing protein [Falsiroseomonas sp. HW251]|uniref:DUF5872 domain-containing protein n=1 Tax=Falsiroseomonas sp. HW251 TaxID=3390998 RepID=UPI003D31765E